MNPTNVIRRYPLLAVLPPGPVAAWLAAGEVRAVELGETLFRAGTPGTHAYLVRSGRARVLRHGKDDREIVLGAFGPGELFGEYALLPPGLNTATCRAADRGEMLRLPLGPLRDLIAREPAVGSHLKRWLRLHAILGHLRDRSFLGFMSVTSLLTLLERTESARFPAGRSIQAAGLSEDYWFAVLKGRVRLDSAAGSGPGSPMVLGPGDSFGEGALVGREDLPTAEAESATECLALRRDTFYEPTSGGGASIQTHLSHPGVARDAYPWVGQQEATDCGVASLAMVVRFHGLDVSPATIRRGIDVGQRGTSMGELQRAATALGFRSQAVRVGPEQLDRVGLPAIAHLAGDHYVVLYTVTASGLVVSDPAIGIRTLSAEAFRASWTQQLLLMVWPGGPT